MMVADVTLKSMLYRVMCVIVIWEDFVYVLTVSDHKIYAVKKRYVSPEA